jgi:serine/threonine protein kinase
VELHHNHLVVKGGINKRNTIGCEVPLNADTKVTFVAKKDLKHSIISVQNEGKKISFRGCGKEDVVQWLAEMRSQTFYNPSLSMEKFEVMAVLGRGFFGKVMMCRHKETGDISAIKTIRKNMMIHTQRVHTILSERAILGKLKHPFITEMRFAFQSSTKFYIGLEYVSGGELFGLLERQGSISLADARIYIAEIGLALNELHDKNIVYRDLKPENILIGSDGHLKLADFGLSKEIQSSTSSFCGTLTFMSPEIILQRPYSFEVDDWSLGILAYELLCGEPPFYHSNRDRMMGKILQSEPVFNDDIDPNAVDFIKRLLVKDAKKRASFKDLMNHPFFDGMSMTDVLQKKFVPSFVPEIRNQSDSHYFDDQFTEEPPVDSMASVPLDNDEMFYGFDFINGPSSH